MKNIVDVHLQIKCRILTRGVQPTVGDAKFCGPQKGLQMWLRREIWCLWMANLSLTFRKERSP